MPPQPAQQQYPPHQQHLPPQQQYAAQQQYAPPQGHPGQPPAPSAQPAPGTAVPGAGRSHFGHALLSEWTKIRTVRSTMWTLVLMFVLTVGIGLLVAAALSGEDYTGMPLLSSGLFGLMLGQLCIITLGVLVITSEYGTGMIRTTLTACPHRGRVLLAKAVVFFLLSFTMTLAATALTALFTSSLLSGQTVPPEDWDDPVMKDSVENGELVASSGHWLGATVGAALYVALLGLLGLAVGALLRHSAGAITTMVGLVLLPLVLALFMMVDSLSGLRDALIEYSPLNGLASLYRLPFQGGTDTGWPLLGLLAAVTVAALVAAYAKLTATDV
ncbi:ABC transporter permease [Streptomyces sp. 7-21]|nr:ABC transporter permease [Streptomyces sp. 7-21]